MEKANIDSGIRKVETMGYGTVAYGSHATAASGDDGIDGIIMEDKLGFSLIYMKAKKWAPDRAVGQPEIQSFVGAIAGKHGDGLFITTARFSQKAKNYANIHHIILIDGEKLANLMIEHNFCVATRKTFEIKAIDTDALAEWCLLLKSYEGAVALTCGSSFHIPNTKRRASKSPAFVV